jgi:hypothetical protein
VNVNYLINGGFLLVGAAIAFLASYFAARKTAEATLASTRLTVEGGLGYHLWERRADAYIDALGYVAHRVEGVATNNRGFLFDDETEKRIRDFLASYQLPEWFQLDARLRAFSSDAVYARFTAAESAVRDVVLKANSWKLEADRNMQESRGAAGGQAAVDAWAAIGASLDLARDANAQLGEAIRDELRERSAFDAPHA